MAQVRLITVKEAARMLGRQVRTIRGWIYSGKLDAVKSGTGYKWFVFLDDVEEILEAKNHADKN